MTHTHMPPQSSIPQQTVAVKLNSTKDSHSYASSALEEINLLEYVYALLKNKWKIVGVTLVGFLLGVMLAFVKGPEYVAEAKIAAKESESQPAASLSGLGVFGGLVSSQLNLGGNANLDKIALILESRKFNIKIIEDNNLYRDIFMQEWPKVCKKYWDEKSNQWAEGFVPPKTVSLALLLKKKYLKKIENEDNTMTLMITSEDSLFSEKLLSTYLTYLDTYIRSATQNEAASNVKYLENQLVSITDPLLREKLQAIIATELEKSMLVSKEAFRIIDPLYRQTDSMVFTMFPAVVGIVFFVLAVLAVLFQQAFNSVKVNEKDERLIANIRAELFSLPGRRRGSC